MSRSLGDTIVHKSGVSAEPEISERIIDEFDDFFILATDGVWDVVDNNYAVQIIHSFIAKYHQIGAHLKPQMLSADMLEVDGRNCLQW